MLQNGRRSQELYEEDITQEDMLSQSGAVLCGVGSK